MPGVLLRSCEFRHVCRCFFSRNWWLFSSKISGESLPFNQCFFENELKWFIDPRVGVRSNDSTTIGISSNDTGIRSTSTRDCTNRLGCFSVYCLCPWNSGFNQHLWVASHKVKGLHLISDHHISSWNPHVQRWNPYLGCLDLGVGALIPYLMAI